mmetsp:Transcript_15569/g.47438  ORF Transcript_15569/g.47438 Transcript_15569/m.47438 type:complete len:252 (+) Transcript_15569:1590-2345(+)
MLCPRRNTTLDLARAPMLRAAVSLELVRRSVVGHLLLVALLVDVRLLLVRRLLAVGHLPPAASQLPADIGNLEIGVLALDLVTVVGREEEERGHVLLGAVRVLVLLLAALLAAAIVIVLVDGSDVVGHLLGVALAVLIGAGLVRRLLLVRELAPLAADLLGDLGQAVVGVRLAHRIADGVREEHERRGRALRRVRVLALLLSARHLLLLLRRSGGRRGWLAGEAAAERGSSGGERGEGRARRGEGTTRRWE